MYLKNDASPKRIFAGVVNASTGEPITGGVAIKHYDEAGTQTTGDNSANYELNGTWSYVPSQAETNYTSFAIKFYHADAVGNGPLVQVVTTTINPDPTDGAVESDVVKISGDSTAADNLELQYDTTGLTGGTFPASQAQVGSSVVEYPDDGRMMAGASESNTYAKLAVNDDDYWSCTDPDNSNPLEMCVYVNAGSGTFPDAVVIDARYNAQNNRRVHVFAANVDDVAAISDATATATDASPSVLTHSVAGSFAGLTLAGYDIYITSGTNATADFYTIASHTDDVLTLDRNCSSGGAVSVIDFIVMVWDQISNDANAILHKTGADGDYEYPLGVSYMTTDNNEVFLRFSDEGQGVFKTNYDLRLDQVGVITKSLAGGSVSVETLAAAVHTELDDHFRHIPSFTGEVFYVSPTGSDANSGHDPASPLLTIGVAITTASAGDWIEVKAGTYTEAGIDLSKSGLELHGEIGAILTGGGGVPLTISTDYCRTDEIILTPAAGQIGLVITSDHNKVGDAKVIGGLTAVQDTGTGNEIDHVSAEEYTATGFDLQGDEAHVLECQAVSSQANTRGYYLSNTGADRTVVSRSISVNNDTAGFEVVSGVTNAAFVNCTESPTCGARVDAGTNTAWRNHSRSEHQQDIAQVAAGTAGVVYHVKASGGADGNGLSWDDAYLHTTTSVKTVIEAASAGDVVIMGPGTFALGNNVIDVPVGVSVIGAGIDVTTITSTHASSVAIGLGNNCFLATFTLNANNYGIGSFQSVGQGAFTNANLYRIKCSALADAFLASHSSVQSSTFRECIWINRGSGDGFSVLQSGAGSQFWLIDNQIFLTSTGSNGILHADNGTIYCHGTDIYSSADATGAGIKTSGGIVAAFGGSINGSSAFSLINSSGTLTVIGVEYDRSKTSGTITEVSGLDAAMAASPTADSIMQRLQAIDVLTEASGGGDLAAMKAKMDNLPSSVPKNVALSNFSFLMVNNDDHFSPETGLTVTAEISKDGGAFAACTNSVSEIANGVYKISFTQAEMNADVLVWKMTATDADQRTITVLTDT